MGRFSAEATATGLTGFLHWRSSLAGMCAALVDDIDGRVAIGTRTATCAEVGG